MSYDVFTGLLKMFADFTNSSGNVDLNFDASDKRLQILKDKYLLDNIAGQGDDLSRSLNILFWLSNNTIHYGDYGYNIPSNSLDLLEYAFQQEKDHGINCRALSIVLTECLLSIGIMARTVYILPFSPYDFDNHVITHAFIKTLNKWILLDPTYGSYVMDDKNNILDVFEIRERLSNQEKILFNKEINYNGEKWTEKESDSYIEYLAKDLFYFQTNECSKFDAENNNRKITISPKCFDAKNRNIYNAEYRVKHSDNSENMLYWLKYAKENKVFYTTSEELLKSPDSVVHA